MFWDFIWAFILGTVLFHIFAIFDLYREKKQKEKSERLKNENRNSFYN